MILNPLNQFVYISAISWTDYGLRISLTPFDFPE